MEKLTRTPLIEEYEINPNTMMIMPVTYGSKVYSHVWEFNDEIISPFKPTSLVNNSCKLFASSYQGRREGTRELIGATHKAPIAIDPSNLVYFFPTLSPSRLECYWISLEHVEFYRQIDKKKTEVIFKNKRSCELPVSYRSFHSQYTKSVLLKFALGSKIESSEKKAIYYFNGQSHMNASEGVNRYKMGRK